MVLRCCAKDIVRDVDKKYATQPGIIKQKWVPSKTVKLYNKSKYFVELDIKDRRGTFLRSMNLGAMNANAGLEFENGDHEDVQTVKILPGMVKKIRVGTWSYMITAYMNGKLLFKNRVYSTRYYPCFFDRHYGEADNKSVREVPQEHIIEPPTPPPETKQRKWYFLFLL